MSRRVAIVTTTIFPLDFLSAYADNLRAFGRQRDVTIYVAGDRKSPAVSEEQAAACRAAGVDARFLSLEAQAEVLRPYPDLAAIVPENSDNRRNAAFVAALRDGAEVVISIDDDNWCLPDEDFVGGHLAVGKTFEHPEGLGDGGWFNLCSLLRSEPAPELLFPRGFPYAARSRACSRVGAPVTGRVGVNVGLWLGDPDTDAIGRLAARPVTTAWTGDTVFLGRGIRSPINTQNTAVSREAMAAYYYVRMGAELRGLRLDRFGDILSGYFLQVCGEAVGDRVRIGGPIVDHRRHPHDLLVDLYHELAGVMMLEDLAGFFSDVQLPCDSYLSAYRALSHELERFAEAQQGFVWRDETRAYVRDVARWMRIWADVVADIG